MIRSISVLFITMIMLFGCSFASPDAGYEAVLVAKPILFGHGGVSSDPVKAGREMIAITTKVVTVDVRPQLFTVHLDDFFTKDGVPLDFDATLRLRVIDSVRIVREFGTEWYQKNIKPEFVRAVRDAVKKHGMNEAALTVTASEVMDHDVTKQMADYITSKKLPVELMEVTLGRANPPDAIKGQRIETAAQEQRQNTEKQRKLAEDQRKEAELSRAAADNAYRESMQLSPDQFLSLEQIKMLKDVCSGKKDSCTFLIGSNSVIPTLNVNK